MESAFIKTDLPYTFCTFKGNIPWTFHNYLKFLIQSTDSDHDVLKFAHEYRLAQRDKKHCVQLPLPGPLRVVRGAPVIGQWANYQVYFNEGTETLCTYNTDKKRTKMYVILDKDRIPDCVFSGMYRASIKVKTKSEFWNKVKEESPYAEMANIQAEIHVTLEEYLEPFRTVLEFQESKAEMKKREILKMEEYQPGEFPRSFKEFMSDFKSIFGL